MEPQADHMSLLSRRLLQSRKVVGMLVASILLTVATAIIVYFRNIQGRESARWVTHTHEVIEAAHELLSEIDAAEANQHSFLLESDSSFLRAHLASIGGLDSNLSRIKVLVSDNPGQSSVLANHLTPLIHEQMFKWKKYLDVVELHRPETRIVILKDPLRYRILDSIRVYGIKFIGEEERLSAVRNAALRYDYRLNDTIRWSCLSAIALISVFALAMIRQQQDDNNQLVDHLNALNSELELRVKNRTQELEDKNRDILELHSKLETHNQVIRESLDEVYDLYENAPCGYHSVDQDGFIIRMNKTELEWLGYTAEEMIGKIHASEIITPQSIGKRVAYLETLKKEGHVENFEFEMVRKDGTIFPVVMNTSIIAHLDGNQYRTRSSIFDNTYRKLLETRLQEANTHLTNLNDEKNRFIGITTHDLKSPLNSMTGLIQLIKLSGLTQDQRQYVDMIDGAILRMKNLITKLLDLNRIEQSAVLVQRQSVSLPDLMVRLQESFTPSARKKGIALKIENDAGPVVIDTDPMLLGQVLDNLVSNAIKFSPKGKTVRVRLEQDPSLIRFKVIDEGPGIRPDELPRLFGAFQQLSAQPTDGETSTGLGLSIVKGFAESLGGSINVESKVGVGSTFIFALSRAELKGADAH